MTFWKKYKKYIALSIFLLLLIGTFLLTLGLKGWNEEGVVFYVKDIILNNLIGVNALLLGILTLIGYLVLGRGVANSILGALKTAIGVLLLSIGSGALLGLAKPIFQGLTGVTSAQVAPLDPYLGWTSSDNFLAHGVDMATNFVPFVSFALLIGFIVNIILIALKRFTNVQSLMVTGHVMFQQTSIMFAMVYLFGFTGMTMNVGQIIGLIIFVGLIMGVYWGCSSTATIKPTNIVTNNANFAVGHQQMLGAALAYRLGGYVGNAADSAETRKMSKKFKIFEDNIFTQTMIILILFLILIIIIQTGTAEGFNPSAADSPYKAWNEANGAFWLVNAFLGSLKIIASIIAITTGVRMFVAELQQSFQGISQKILPGAVVAVDCAATYGFAPNSVTFGFVSGLIGQFLGVAIVIGISAATKGSVPIVIPLFITLFFNSGTVGVFANASGGFRATLILPFVFGLVEIILAAVSMYLITNAYEAQLALGNVVESPEGENYSPIATGYIGMFDWNVIWGLTFMIASANHALAFIIFVVVIFLLLLLAQFSDSGLQKRKTFFQNICKIKINLNQQNISKNS